MKAIQTLKNRLQENHLEDDDDLLFYVQYASRLASLGEMEGFDKLETIIKEDRFADRFDSILVERCREGISDLDNLTGKELGFALIEAQDFWSFYIHSENCGFYSTETAALLEEWAEKTTGIWGNNETVEVINCFRNTYPLNEDDLLAVIDSPISEEDIETACSAILIEE